MGSLPKVATLEFSGAGGKRLSPAALRTVVAGMERDGVAAFGGLFPLTLLREMRAEVLRRHESGGLLRRGLVRDIGGRYAAVLPFEGPFLTPGFYAEPRLLAMLDALLGTSYCIGSLEAVISRPGASRQHQHIDGPIRFDRKMGKRTVAFPGDLSALPHYAVTLCVPLCDVDEENGPTAVWKGSHRVSLGARPPSEAAIGRKFPEARMAGPFGRSFLFDYRVFHGGMPNHSREPRALLMFVFTRTWFRDPNLAEVFPGVVISKRELERVPERHKFLFARAPQARRFLWETRR